MAVAQTVIHSPRNVSAKAGGAGSGARAGDAVASTARPITSLDELLDLLALDAATTVSPEVPLAPDEAALLSGLAVVGPFPQELSGGNGFSDGATASEIHREAASPGLAPPSRVQAAGSAGGTGRAHGGGGRAHGGGGRAHGGGRGSVTGGTPGEPVTGTGAPASAVSDGGAPRRRSFTAESFYSASTPEALSVLLPPGSSPQRPDPREVDIRTELFKPLDLRIEYERRPDYVSEGSDRRSSWARTNGVRLDAFVNLFEKELYRHTRRLLKRYWRRQFRDSTAMRYELYHDRLTQINQVGKEPEQFDPFNTDYYGDQLRDEVLNIGFEGEREIVLVEYGPFQLNDEGALHIDLPRTLQLGLGEDDLKLHVGESDGKQPALYSGKWVKFRPRIKIKVDPFRAVGGDTHKMLRSYGGSLSVEFYSDILRKELFATEIEARAKPDGDFAFVFNIVFHGRH
jgi:hypothetical protein